MASIAIQPARRPLDATVRLPGSKSLTNRALVVAALASGRTTLTGALFSDDTEYMAECLMKLGFGVSLDPDGEKIEVTGMGGHVPSVEADCFCGNSGTTIRFGLALAATGGGTYRFDGTARMRQRPIGPLAEALRALGAAIEFEADEGFPPLTVRTTGLSGGTVVFREPPSSQFISALLLAGPAARGDVMLEVRGQLVSKPYVRMTAAVMDAFGVGVIEDYAADRSRFIVAAPQFYRACTYEIEPDASNASYFLAAPAVAGGKVTVEGLGTESIQGDVRFTEVLAEMGCHVERAASSLTVHGPPPGTKLRAVRLDLNDIPDVAQTAAVTALFADGPSRFENIANLRVKETDRLAALAKELTALGARVEEEEAAITIHPPARITPATIRTYDDHRMAMSFSLAGLAAEGVAIDDPGCVAKTFPDFFARWQRLSQ